MGTHRHVGVGQHGQEVFMATVLDQVGLAGLWRQTRVGERLGAVSLAPLASTAKHHLAGPHFCGAQPYPSLD